MATIAVELPGLLRQVVAGERLVEVEAATLAETLAALTRLRPQLRVHLFDESGQLRRHVLCFLNGTNTRWMEDLDIPVQDGDTLTIMQAVSGGRPPPPSQSSARLRWR